MATKKYFHCIIILVALFSPIVGSSSQLDCRSKSAYVIAKLKSEYYDQIPNETIEFARSAAMEMCLSNNIKSQKVLNTRTTEKAVKSQPQKKSFLGIMFGDSERRKEMNVFLTEDNKTYREVDAIIKNQQTFASYLCRTWNFRSAVVQN